MKITRRRTKIQYQSCGEKVTLFSGLKLIFDLADKLGVVPGCKSMSVKRRARGIGVEDFILSLAGNFIVGGDTLSDLEILRHESSTREHLYGLDVPAATTAGEYLRKFNLGHIRQLEAVIAAAMAKAESWVGGGDKRVTLDLDSSIFESHSYFKEGVRYGYTGEKGYHPLLCFWQERRLLIGFQLRAGNRNTNLGAEAFLKQNLRRLPAGSRVLVRTDAGFYSHKIERACVQQGAEFSFSARLTAKLMAKILSFSEVDWQPYHYEQETQWVEFSHQPKHFSRCYRLLVKRAPLYEGQQLCFNRYHYSAVLTNRRGPAADLLKHHFARGGAENYIEEFKNGIGARLTPSQKFNANWAWLTIAQLAYNLVQWFKLLVLPRSQQSFQMKKLRLYWFCVPARLVRSARKVIAYLARPPDIAAEFYHAQSLIHQLP